MATPLSGDGATTALRARLVASPWLAVATMLAGVLLAAWVDQWRTESLWIGALAGFWLATHVTQTPEVARAGGRFTGWRGAAVLTLVVCAIACVRKPDAWLNPQLWAEDGTVFVRDAWLLGPRAFIEPYAGYLHLLPRMAAATARLVPVLFVPHVFLLWTLVPVVLVCLYLSSPRLPLVARERLVLAALVAFPPAPGEVLLNVTNAQWILGFVFVVLLLVRTDENRAFLWLDAPVVCLAGLTGPFSLVFAPFFAIRALLRPARGTIARAAMVMLAGGAQALVLWGSGRMLTGHPAPPDVFVATLGARVARTLRFGIVSEESAFLVALILMAAVLLLLGLFVVGQEWRSAVCLLSAVVLFTSYVLALRAETYRLAFGDERYFSLPLGLLLWACVLARGPIRPLSATVAATIVCLAAPGFPVEALRDYRWRDQSACLATREACHVPINPEGWSIDLPAR